MPFAVDRRDIEDTVVVAVRGELDIGTAPDLRVALMEAIERQPDGRIIADLEGLEFIDSAGLGILIGGRKRAQAGGGDLVLVSTGRNVAKILELTGLMRVFDVYSSVSDAREAARPD
ncbi:STAS domain-containing protein [Solirubrobacter sp. CPCC 204708]|uniref:Anti-sigma factor antagonist n=1 Tax=Solirubrobacter deserti TaxID=2282478 RepID=A0ABT4RFF2_9ACTN|nr:STAS domain-containing protein [Solirubrobacter deserti]MBE2319447.1 STAS domain-containing protein [Solirubrobacter deserti]MDA0137269.1 STAS domain-containing protein [Solirubrobacter deserti]